MGAAAMQGAAPNPIGSNPVSCPRTRRPIRRQRDLNYQPQLLDNQLYLVSHSLVKILVICLLYSKKKNAMKTQFVAFPQLQDLNLHASAITG